MRIAAISAIPLARQTRNKRQNHKNGKTTTKDKREPEDNMKRANTDQPTMAPTPSARQTRVKQRRIHERGRSSTRDKRCFDENMNKALQQTRSAVMPPRSRRQNSVVNSHPDTESNAHNQAVGEAQQNNGGNMEGGGIPEGNPGGGNPGGQPPLTLIYELIQSLQQNQGELAESIRQLKESSNNREAHGGNGRNHEERDHHDERDSNNKNDAPFVTMSDVADLLKQERERPPKEPRHFVRKPPYPKELLKEPYPEKYDTPNFSLFDGRKGSAVEHISKFLDSMGPFAGNGGLCLQEFSKSLIDRAYTWYAMLPEESIRDWEDMVESFCSKYFHVEEKITLFNLHSTKQLPGEDLLKYIHRFRDISLDCHVKYEESELVEARKTALSVKPHSEKAKEKKSQHQALTVSTTTAPNGNKRKRPVEKINKPPTEEEKRDPKFCRYHRYVHHPTADCRSLRWELNRKIQDGTLQLSPEQQRVHKNPFPNYRKDQGKAVVSVVIQGSTSDMEIDESAVADTTLTPAVVRTLQKSPKFKSLFNQLGLGPEARNAATEAIIAIAADSRATCFTAETHASRAFLETTNAVTFTDDDMEVQYLDHRRPFYVSAVIKDVQVRRALVDTGSCLNLIPLSTLKAANIPQHKIQGAPIEVTVPYHALLGRPWLHKHKLISSTYHQCIKGRLNGKPIRIAANPSPFDQTEAHFIEATLYDELSTEEPPIIKPSGTPLPDWEDIKNDPDVDLREVLERKKKRKERMAEDENAPRCIRVQMPDGRINEAEGHKKLAMEKEEVKLEKSAEVDSKIIPMEDLEVINLSHDPSVDKPVSISTSLSAVERACLISLLKEYQDVFAWKYDEMPGIDSGLVAHSLNVEPGTKPVVQPARTFHTEVEAQITQEVKKLLAAGFIKPIQHPRWLSNIVSVKKKNGQIRCCVDFRNLNKACLKDEFPLPNMDLLIDSAAGSAMFSFMDGFSGYNQIRMSPRDAEKTAFRTPIGNFYYTVMPFGLKNAGATYQRTMTAMFHDMIHQEIEDYVDDILKMNPLKCAFGVSAGKFLGFLVHNRGIDCVLQLLENPFRLYLASNSQAIGALVAQEDDDGIEQPVYYRLRHLLLGPQDSVDDQVSSQLEVCCTDQFSQAGLPSGYCSYRNMRYLLKPQQRIKSQGYRRPPWLNSLEKIVQQFHKSGAGVVLIREDGETIAKSFKLDFPCSNNASEYEAYITGLAIAHGMGIKHLRGPTADVTINKRSTPITELLREEYEEGDCGREDWRTPLKRKLISPEGVADLKVLKDFVLISGDLYRRLPGGILARCVSLQEGTKKLQEVHEKSCELEGGVSLYRRLQRLGYFWPDMSKEAADLQRRCPTCQHQHENEQVCATFLSSDWRTPFLEYFIEGILPQTGREAVRIKKLSTRYFVESGILFRKGFHGDPLRCLSLSESQTVMKEAHSGECGEHQGKKRLYQLLLTLGYYWPTMKRDTADFVKACHTCQMQANLIHTHPTNLQNMATPWPFHTWGLDLIGPINPPSDGYIWILAATEYFTKWVEAIPLRKATGAAVANFIREHIITRFGIPHKIISDNGNGQAEATNRMLLRILSKMVFDYGKGWNSHLADVLWAYRGSPKTATGFTPFSLVYGTDVISPPELLVPSPRMLQGTELEADIEICAEARVADLESLDEARELALARSLRYHQKLANAYGKTVHTRIFSQGQMVLKTADHVRRGLPSPSKFTPN
uniref:Integrase catalytic domain-containing protein n=1 Tax=Fagus sylvatica TaxID=28930 RepID=A0A2N9H877_FAGSY